MIKSKKIILLLVMGVLFLSSSMFSIAKANDHVNIKNDDLEYVMQEAANEAGDFPVAVIDVTTTEEKYIRSGQTFAVKLEENATTGYIWHYTIDNQGIINFLDDGSEIINPQLIGGPSVHYWNFKAKKEGTTTLTFSLYRDFEGAEVTLETHQYSITVIPEDTEIKHDVDHDPDKIGITNYKKVSDDISNHVVLSGWVRNHYSTKGIYYKNVDDKDYVLIAAGECSTAGYSIIVNELFSYDDPYNKKVLYVDSEVQSPERDQMVAQVITYPYTLLELNTDYKFEKVEPITNKKDINVFVNHNAVQMDVKPIIEKGRTLVPFRAIFEALGTEVTWDDVTKTVTAIKNETRISFEIGSCTAVVNGNEVTIDVPAKIVESRTLVPIRFISESLGYKVDWDNMIRNIWIKDQQKAFISQKGMIKSIEYGKDGMIVYLENENPSENEYDKIYITINVTTEILGGKYEDIKEGIEI